MSADFPPVGNEHADHREPLRADVLATASRLITGDRQADYGDAAVSFGRIAALWGEILHTEVTAQQVALCMVALKISRSIEGPGKADSYVDMAGYAALAAELAGVPEDALR